MQKIFLSISITLLIFNIITFPTNGNSSKYVFLDIFPQLNNIINLKNKPFWFDTSVNFDDPYAYIKNINASRNFCVYPAHGIFSEIIAGFKIEDLKFIYSNHVKCNYHFNDYYDLNFSRNSDLKYILLIDGWTDQNLHNKLISNGWEEVNRFRTAKFDRNIFLLTKYDNYK